MIAAFIDECRQAGHAVESVCRVLTSQGCQIAARTYRAWASARQVVADRTVSDAIVLDAVRDAAWTVDEFGPVAGVRRLTPEGLYGRRKMTALIKRRIPHASPGSMDLATKALGLNGIRRAKGVRARPSPPRTGGVPVTCWIRTPPLLHQTARGSWISSTYARGADSRTCRS